MSMNLNPEQNKAATVTSKHALILAGPIRSAQNSTDRTRKIRNTINVALGTQKARGQPSTQAIEKWEADLDYIDNELKNRLEADS